jgi:hypothetical protein
LAKRSKDFCLEQIAEWTQLKTDIEKLAADLKEFNTKAKEELKYKIAWSETPSEEP